MYPGARCDLWKASSILGNGSSDSNGQGNSKLPPRGLVAGLPPSNANTLGSNGKGNNMLALMNEHINEKLDLFAFTHWAEPAPYYEDQEVFNTVLGRKRKKGSEQASGEIDADAEADAKRSELFQIRTQSNADWRASGTTPSWLPGPVDKSDPGKTRITNAGARTAAMLSQLRVDVISSQELLRLKQIKQQHRTAQQTQANLHQEQLYALARGQSTVSESTSEQAFQDAYASRRRAAMIRLDEELRAGNITHAQYLNMIELLVRKPNDLQPHQLLHMLQNPESSENSSGAKRPTELATYRGKHEEDAKSTVERKIRTLQMHQRQQALRTVDAADALLTFYHTDVEDRKSHTSTAPDPSGRKRLTHHDDFVRQLDASLRRGQITQAQYDNMYSAFLMSDEEDRRSQLRDLEALVPRQASQSNWNALDRSLWIRICRFLTYTETALLARVSKAIGAATSAQEIWYPKCHAFFLAHEPNWILPEPNACADWKQYMRTYFTKWVPLALEKSKPQHVEGLHVAVRFKPLPNEEQVEKKIALRNLQQRRQQRQFQGPSLTFRDSPEESKDIHPARYGSYAPVDQHTPETGTAPPAASSPTTPGSVGSAEKPKVKFADGTTSPSRTTSPTARRSGSSSTVVTTAQSSRSQRKKLQDELDEARSLSKEKCRIDSVSEPDCQVRTTAEDRPRVFTFDTVFCGTTTQKAVYERLIRNLTRDVLFGFNATVFVYGQTASGKTWTMFGPDIIIDKEANITQFPDKALWGIVPRACEQILETLNREHGTEYKFEVTYVEIYDNTVYDLLNGGKHIEVAEYRDEFYLVDPKMWPARSMADIEDILTEGERQKTVHATGMNQRSSRSHCLFTINLQQDNEERGFHEKNKYNLVDLAGSERYNKSKTHGKRFEEAKQINRSLQTLERCIDCLTNPNPQHIPYRESTLTKMLQQALGGSTNCKRILLVTCSHDQDQILETLSALRFAERASQINNNLGRARKLAL